MDISTSLVRGSIEGSSYQVRGDLDTWVSMMLRYFMLVDIVY